MVPAVLEGLAEESTTVDGNWLKQSSMPTENVYVELAVSVPELFPLEVIFGVEPLMPVYELRDAACSVQAVPLNIPTKAVVPELNVAVAFSSVVEFH